METEQVAIIGDEEGSFIHVRRILEEVQKRLAVVQYGPGPAVRIADYAAQA